MVDLKTFGQEIQDRREAKELSMRDLGFYAGVSASYVCDIEHDRRIPAEDVTVRLAGILGWDKETACACAGHLGRTAERQLKRRPVLVRLVRYCVAAQLTDAQIEWLIS